MSLIKEALDKAKTAKKTKNRGSSDTSEDDQGNVTSRDGIARPTPDGHSEKLLLKIEFTILSIIIFLVSFSIGLELAVLLNEYF